MKRCIQIAYRYFAFCITFTTYLLLISYYLWNQDNIESGYANDAKKKTGPSWVFVFNIMMDYGSTALRVVGVQFIIMFRVEKCWKKLIISLDETEHNLSNIVTSSHVEQRKDYYRTLSFSGIFYILTTVLISYNLPY